jgi:GT2 family glycosyltransferase
MNNGFPLRYSVVICTYMRPRLCAQTIAALVPSIQDDAELIVVDQTPESEIIPKLGSAADTNGKVLHLRLSEPSLVKARNRGIQKARGEIIIFLDDDIVPLPGLVEGHLAAYAIPEVGGVAGRIMTEAEASAGVLDQCNAGSRDWTSTRFNHMEAMPVMTARGCNMSFRRELLIEIGGFDTHYYPPLSFREDSDICFRLRQLGHKIMFVPEAAVIHLKATEGGTRDNGARSTPLSNELALYRRHFQLYRNNLYFAIKNFHGKQRLVEIWRGYRIHVGLSRWPWRLLSKNICFILALIQMWYCAAISHPPYFEQESSP